MGGDKRRKPRIALGSVLALAALIAGASPVLATRGSVERITAAPIEGKVLDQLAANGKASVAILLEDQADLSAAYGMSEDARGRYVYKTLVNHAARTQAPIKALLASHGVSYRSYWVANVLYATGDRALDRVSRCAFGREDDRVEREVQRSPRARRCTRRDPLARCGRARRDGGERRRPLGAWLHRPGDRDREPGHRHQLDP